jgi:hypothetical protein
MYMMVEKGYDRQHQALHQNPEHSEWILHQLLIEVGENIICWH